MAKKESSLIQLILVLFIISAVAGGALAGVFMLTKEPIAQSQKKKKNEAMQNVLPGFNGEIKEVNVLAEEGDKDSVNVNLAYTKDELFGIVVESYTDKGFSGRFTVMVGFDPTGKITGAEVLSHKESPGLGDKMEKSKSDFSNQFTGKDPQSWNLRVTKDGGDVVAITAATITSRGFADAVERAHKAFLKVKEVDHE